MCVYSIHKYTNPLVMTKSKNWTSLFSPLVTDDFVAMAPWTCREKRKGWSLVFHKVSVGQVSLGLSRNIKFRQIRDHTRPSHSSQIFSSKSLLRNSPWPNGNSKIHKVALVGQKRYPSLDVRNAQTIHDEAVTTSGKIIISKFALSVSRLRPLFQCLLRTAVVPGASRLPYSFAQLVCAPKFSKGITREILWSESPWLGEELEKAWENDYEVQGYSPFATCGNDQCRSKDLCVSTSAALPSTSFSSPLHAPFTPTTPGSQVPGVDSPCSPLHQVQGGISPSRGNASKTRASLP